MWKCPHLPCTKDFLRETHLKHHIKSAHSDVRDYVCEWEGCDKSFATGTRLRRHHAAHEGREKYKCSVTGCGQTFRKHGTLQQHISIVHEGQKPFHCRDLNEDGTPCNSRFDTASQLKSHKIRLHEGNKYYCDLCSSEVVEGMGGETFGSSTNPVVGFPTYSELKDHVKAVHPPTCKECGLKCTTSRGLAKHIEIQHSSQPLSERQTHLCLEPGCGRGFTKKGTLTVHIQTVHQGKKNFVCGVTDLSTSSAEKLPFWSKENVASCGRAFPHKANLEEHVRTVHLGLPPYRNATAVSTPVSTDSPYQGLTRSKRKEKPSTISILTGTAYTEDPSRNIPCLIVACEYRFTREYDLDIHLQKYHGYTDWDIQVMKVSPRGHVTLGFDCDESRSLPVQGDKALNPAINLLPNPSTDAMGINSGATVPPSEGPIADHDLDQEFQEAILHGGRFWVGGAFEDAFQPNFQWDREQAEMRALCSDIGDYNDNFGGYSAGYDGQVIDPNLR